MNKRYKYPRTPHVPWSLGATDDDKRLSNMDHFVDMDVIVTEKMDGENSTLYNDGCHARSLDSGYHSSRTWLKSLHSTFQHEIPDGIRICGENLYAYHSIYYDNLISYFYGFSVWVNDRCLPWEETQLYFELLNITPVPVIYSGIYNEKLIKDIDIKNSEGYVIRNSGSFMYNDFSKNVAKFVRQNHVQTDDHWMHKSITTNKLKIG